MSWLSDFGVQTAAGVAAIVIVTAVPRIRVPVFRVIAVTATWIWQSRPAMTVRKHKQLMARVQLDTKAAEMKAVKLWSDKTKAGLSASVRAAREEGRKEGYAQGYQVRDDEVKTERAKPVREPKWSVRRTPQVEWFLLSNAGWAVTDVVLDAPPLEFVFDANPEWDELGSNGPGESIGKQFRGTVLVAGKRHGVNFRVSWTDENGDRRDSIVHLDRAPLTAFGPD